MVTRKSPVPYPTSPPPAPPTFGPPQSIHDVDLSDVPPVPQTSSREPYSPMYQDMGNPWDDEKQLPALPNHAQPDSVELSKTTVKSEASLEKQNEQKVPDVLKAGWSGQNTPRSSIDSDRSRDFWEESSEDEKEKQKSHEPGSKIPKDKQSFKSNAEVPQSLQIRRKPVSPSLSTESPPESAPDFASNNPFRQPAIEGSSDPADDWMYVQDSKGKSKAVNTGFDSTSPQIGDLHLGSSNLGLSSFLSASNAPDESPWASVERPAANEPTIPPPYLNNQQLTHDASPFSEQPPLIAVSPNIADESSAWNASRPKISPRASPLPDQKAISSEDLLDRSFQSEPAAGQISLGDELKSLPNHAPGPQSSSSLSLLDDGLIPSSPHNNKNALNDHSSSLPLGPSFRAQQQTIYRDADFPPVKPPRPAEVVKPLTAAEIALMNEQRNETYHIKHFRWFDHRTRKLRASSMLTQNKNGPCPLLALVNALILGAQDQDQAILDEFLSTREQVTLGTIIENLMMELLSAAQDGVLPDVDELNRFLLKLRTGMNMNPRFVSPAVPAPNLMDARNSFLHLPQEQAPQRRPGGFEQTQDIKLYSAFGVETVHGWLAEPMSDAAAAFERSAQSYEDAQTKLFGEDELEYKLTRDGLTAEEQVIWEDIITIKHFLHTNPTQLTPYGLHCIQTSMKPGSFTVLFRNDHFSTIYKSPQDGRLYTLVTDAGYTEREEIVWESLVDISGQNAEFFSGDFKSVSHNEPRPTTSSSQQLADGLGRVDDSQDLQAPLSPSQRQEQEDADFAMAMQLQEEEEQRDRQRRAQANSSSTTNTSNTSQQTRSNPRRSSGNIPITLSSRNSSTTIPQEVRPLIPPRGARASVPAVNRPSDANAADAPPAYEEAAKVKAYHPPLGSPLHPASSATTEGGNTPVASSSNVNDAGNSNTRGRGRRRSSAYHENHSQYSSRASGPAFGQVPSPAYDFTDGRMPGSYVHTGRGGHGQSANYGSGGPVYGPGPPGSRQRDNRDCIVM